MDMKGFDAPAGEFLCSDNNRSFHAALVQELQQYSRSFTHDCFPFGFLLSQAKSGEQRLWTSRKRSRAISGVAASGEGSAIFKASGTRPGPRLATQRDGDPIPPSWLNPWAWPASLPANFEFNLKAAVVIKQHLGVAMSQALSWSHAGDQQGERQDLRERVQASNGKGSYIRKVY